MHDACNFEQGPHAHGEHVDWTVAFAGMPLETPAQDGWQRLQVRLSAIAPTRKLARWPLRLATAASLALVVAIPWRMQSSTTTEPSTTSAAPDQGINQSLADTGSKATSLPVAPDAIEVSRAATTASMPSPETTARSQEPRRGRHMVAPSRQPIRTAAQAADTTRVASAAATVAPASDAKLESLYAQSAQLEGLLAMARDDSVSSGLAAALTAAMESEVASIDAALTQPDVSLQQRGELWRARVDTLRQLVGIETTQRLYAARGQQYEAALVSID